MEMYNKEKKRQLKQVYKILILFRMYQESHRIFREQ